MSLTHDADGRATIRWELPDEEALDSLAARCRPFILNGDSVYHAKVFNALGYFLRAEHGDLREGLEKLRQDWRQLDPQNHDLLGYGASVGRDDGSFSEVVADIELGFAWMYGDLVHADAERLDAVAPHDLDDRFQAATLLVSMLAVQTISTLNLVRAGQQRGLIPVAEEVFTQAVTARTSRTLPVHQLVTAPVGTPLADMEAALEAAERQRLLDDGAAGDPQGH